MSQHSRGIVLQQLRYSESSLIVKLFSEQHGLLTFMVKGAYGKRSRLRPALFQPLNLLEFVATVQAHKDFQYFTEVAVDVPYHSIPGDPVKRTIALFLAELLSKTLLEQGPNPMLFGFVHSGLLWLDLQHDHFADFHLYFMLELSRHLGFYPRLQVEPDWQVFDLLDGTFRAKPASPNYFLEKEDAQLFRQLAETKLEDLAACRHTLAQRRRLLDILILYYQLHLPVFKGLQAHEVLRAVL
ncbi:MAG TPA: DNA repair protein RecO [Bacteroidales bacterium]|nr:DNA repair protein RecO [Bacteroidales bacterium]